MPSSSDIAAAVLADLKDQQPCVVVVAGPWGSGKTFMWMNDVLPALEKGGRTVVTTSLFGVESVDALRNKLAVGTLFALPKALAEADSLIDNFKQTAGGLAKQLGKAFGQAVDNYAGTAAFASKIDYLDLVPKGVVFCVDDVERAGGDVEIRVVLGVVNYLVEIKQCSVVLVMDDDQLAANRDDFAKFKERVVRTVYRLESDMGSAYGRLVSRWWADAEYPVTERLRGDRLGSIHRDR